MIVIMNRLNGAVLYSSNTATNTLEAVKEAIAKHADLRSADLSSADLSSADLSSANLRYADLSSANLRYANLSYADLRSADLSSANLRYADLRSANLSYADLSYADLSSANLRYANLRSANLSSADLSSANLSYADLSSANLSSANLSSADLSSANLRYANLRSAICINKYWTTPLYSLLHTEGQITAFKLVTPEGVGPYNGGITYEVGKSYAVDAANTDEYEHCGRGINVASLDWCCKAWKNGYRILKMIHTREDIAAIPVGSDGKYRLHRCTVVAEISAGELGLVVAEPAGGER